MGLDCRGQRPAGVSRFVWSSTFCLWRAMAETAINETQEAALTSRLPCSPVHSHLPPSPPSCIHRRTDRQNSHSEAVKIAGGQTVRTNSHQNSHQTKMATFCEAAILF